MLDFIGVESSMLPELYESGIEIGEYDGMKVVTGAMDQVAGGIGAGIIKKGIISEMTGPTMVLFVPTDVVPEFVTDALVPGFPVVVEPIEIVADSPCGP